MLICGGVAAWLVKRARESVIKQVDGGGGGSSARQLFRYR